MNLDLLFDRYFNFLAETEINKNELYLINL